MAVVERVRGVRQISQTCSENYLTNIVEVSLCGGKVSFYIDTWYQLQGTDAPGLCFPDFLKSRSSSEFIALASVGLAGKASKSG